MKTHMHRWRRAAAGVVAGGFVLASGCTVSDVQTVIAGISAVADLVSSATAEEQDVSFSDWLASELSD